MPRRFFLFCLILLSGVAACEDATVDPAVVEELAARTRANAANTLPALFQQALVVTEARGGTAAVGRLLEEWEQRQARVQAAHAAQDAPAVQAGLEALRQEELGIVLRTFGPDIIHRVLAESNEALTEARTRISRAAHAGADVTAAEASAVEVADLISRATALSREDPLKALSLATDAAAQVAAIGDITAELQRVRGVDELFREVAGTLPARQLRRHARLQGEAQEALKAGDKQRTAQLLEAVRAEEIRLVLAARGDDVVYQMLRQLAPLRTELRQALREREQRGDDVARMQRILNTAGELYQRAQKAAHAGDHATALDLGSHAAGLFNSLRHLIATSTTL